MKAEYKKVSDLLVLESEETLQAFEMIELKGGVGLSSGETNNDCVVINKDCFTGSGCTGGQCPCSGGTCGGVTGAKCYANLKCSK